MRLVWHTKKQCYNNCPRVVDHVACTSAKYQLLVTWCAIHYLNQESGVRIERSITINNQLILPSILPSNTDILSPPLSSSYLSITTTNTQQPIKRQRYEASLSSPTVKQLPLDLGKCIDNDVKLLRELG